MDPKIQQGTGVRLSVQQSVNRETPRTDFQTMVKTGAARTVNAVAGSVGMAAPFVPGGAMVGAAIHQVSGMSQQVRSGQGGSPGAIGVNSTGLGGGGAPVAAGSSVGGSTASVQNMAAAGDKDAVMMVETNRMQELNRQFSLQYLQLQQKMQQENREITMLTNVLKTKHDTAKAAINNIR